MEKFERQTITKSEKSLAESIKILEAEIKKLPAYARRKKDEKNWKKIVNFSLGIGIVGGIIFTVCGLVLPLILLPEMIQIIVHSIMLGPLAVCSGLYAIFLWARDRFNAEIKAENKQYAQLEKTIAELKTLAKQQSKLGEKIHSKLECIDGNLVHTTDKQENTEKFLEFSENKEPEYVYKLFETPTAPTNQTIVETINYQTQRNLI